MPNDTQFFIGLQEFLNSKKIIHINYDAAGIKA